MKPFHSRVAGFRQAFSIVRQRIALPLLLLGAGWLFVAGLSTFSFATAENMLKVRRLENPAVERRSANWRQAAFDPAHTAFNRVETILGPSNVGHLTLAWAAPVGTLNLFASPVVSGGKVFIGGSVGLEGHMYAFDAATGATLWVGPPQASFFVDSAASAHGLVFANSIYSTLLAYDAETGAIAWTSDLTDVRASPTLSNRTLYVASSDGTLTALDAETGTSLWSAEGGCCVFDQAPAVDGGRVFQIRTNHTLTAYNARTGSQIWSAPAFSVGTLAASGGVLFFTDFPNVVAVDEATGIQLWASGVLSGFPTVAAPAVANGRVFVTTLASLFALDAATGAVVWTAPVSSEWGPVVANGVVYASSQNGEWNAFDERDGSLLWSVTISTGCGGLCANAVPVVAHGTLYLAGPDNYLRAFRLNR